MFINHSKMRKSRASILLYKIFCELAQQPFTSDYCFWVAHMLKPLPKLKLILCIQSRWYFKSKFSPFSNLSVPGRVSALSAFKFQYLNHTCAWNVLRTRATYQSFMVRNKFVIIFRSMMVWYKFLYKPGGHQVRVCKWSITPSWQAPIAATEPGEGTFTLLLSFMCQT